jgi:hypothetical protein
LEGNTREGSGDPTRIASLVRARKTRLTGFLLIVYFVKQQKVFVVVHLNPLGTIVTHLSPTKERLALTQ